MASADLRDELSCSICLGIYTDPVTLPCGHSFCRTCIGHVLDTQDGSGVYKCPECRIEFQERPALEKNRKLRNITERFRSAHPEQEEAGIPCTYCFQSPVPAVKTCLMCEASLCENHLRIHSKSPEHVLTEPTTSLGNRRCSIHKKVLEYYCCEDAACICVSCSLAGEHSGHQVETLNEASEKKIEKMRNILQKLTSQREEVEKRVQSLEELRRQVQEKAAGVTEDVTALIRDIRERLEALEKRVLSEISRQEKQVSLRASDLIRQLQIKKEELSRKMGDIEELCDMTDPVTVLQRRELDRADYCDAEEDSERRDIKGHNVGDLDVGLISKTLHSGLAGIVTGVTRQRHVPEASDMLLGVNTASDMLLGVNKASDRLVGVNTASGRLLGVNTASDRLVGVNKASDRLVGVNTASDRLVGVNTASDRLVGVNTASDMLLGVNTASDMLLDVNTASDMLLGVNTASDRLVGVNTASDRLVGVNTTSGRLVGVNTTSDRLVGVNTASDRLVGVNTASDMLLDVNTASNYASVSGDLKTVSVSRIKQNRPETPERFQCNQVLSSRSFSSGRHFLKVEVSKSGQWEVGMSYPSIPRRGWLSWIGENSKSWGLLRTDKKLYYVKHDREFIQLAHPPSCRRFGILLHYEAGRLSFYELCDPVRHLHTFTATFTESLHAIFYVSGDNTWVRI